MLKKKIIPKILLFYYLIPYLTVLLFTVLDFMMNYLYLEWYWMPEWAVVIPQMTADYLLMAMIYASFGIMAYAVFFGRMWQKWTIAAISVAASFLLPCLRYLVRHLTYGKTLTNLEMLDLYNEDVTIGVTMLMYAVLALLVILVERLYYAWILREKPLDEKKTFSPKHPVGLTMMIFFGAVMVWTAINFILIGKFTTETVLSLILEYVIDIIGFFLATWAAYRISKWNQTEQVRASF